MKYLYILAFLLACSLSVYSQRPTQFPGQSQAPGQSVFLPSDTTGTDSDTAIVKNGFLSLFKGKPGKAALYSLVIPSGGQVYNRRWWKVPLALGIDGGLVYALVTNRKNFRTTQNDYLTALKMNPVPANIGQLKERRDYFRKWSEYSWVWLIAGHLLTVVDAYVDRHLMDFDISPDLTGLPGTSGITGTPCVALKINLDTRRLLSKPHPLIIP